MSKECTGIAERFAIILNELSRREKVSRKDLEEITGEDKRVLQMDLNQRLKHVFNIQTDNKGNYWMDKKYRGLFTINEINSFSKILGTSELLPELDNSFLSKIIENRSTSSFIINSPYKDSIKNTPDFKTIMNAIDECRGLFFRYNDKSYSLYPYRLLNTYGHWYLCGTHEGVLKTFKFNKLLGVRKNTNSFEMNKDLLHKIEQSNTIWISNKKPITVKLRVKSDFVSYFDENITLPGETNRQLDEDESLVVTVEAYAYEEIKNIVKYWIPRIEVIEPIELKDILREEILDYAHTI